MKQWHLIYYLKAYGRFRLITYSILREYRSARTRAKADNGTSVIII